MRAKCLLFLCLCLPCLLVPACTPAARAPAGGLGGNRPFRGSDAFDKAPRPEWLNSTLGTADILLPPWTPMRAASPAVGDVNVACWGRTYRFQRSGLPAQIISQDQGLLSSPTALKAVVDGKAVSWQNESLRLTAQKQTRVVLNATAASGRVTLQTTTTIEFDGMQRIDLRLSGASGSRLDALTLEIPLRKMRVPFLTAESEYDYMEGTYPYWSGAKNGPVPPQGVSGPFTSCLWMGSNHAGLVWFAESQRNWSNRDAMHVIEIVPQRDSEVVRIHFVDDPIRLNTPLTLTFGLQATPVKKAAPRKVYVMGLHYGIEKEKTAAQTTGTLTYPAKGNIRLDRGAVQVWARLDFDPGVVVAPSTNRALYNQNLFVLQLANGDLLGYYWNIDARSLCAYIRQGGRFPLILTSTTHWKRGETHLLTLSWGDRIALYDNGTLLASSPHAGTLNGSLAGAKLVFSGGFDVDAIRILGAPFAPGSPSALTPTSTAATLLLDTFTRITGTARSTAPVKRAGSVRGALTGQFKLDQGRYGKRVRLAPGGQQISVLESWKQEGVDIAHFHETWTETQGYPKTEIHQAQLRSLSAAVHRAGLKLQLYLSYLIGDNCPEYARYKDEILYQPMKPWMTWQRSDTVPPHTAYMVSYTGQWPNFMLYNLQQTIRTYDVDGFYLDGTYWCYRDTNRAHGAGYIDRQGVLRPSEQIFAYREWIRRLKTMAYQLKPNFRFDMHDSGTIWIPTIAFGDDVLTGEQISALEAGKSRSLRSISFLDEFRAEAVGTQFGFPFDFLEYRDVAAAQAVAYLHGVPVRGAGNYLTIMKLWKDFGVENARWLPYYENQGVISVTPAQVKASLYYRKDTQGILIMVSNLGETSASASLDLNPRSLALPARFTARDVLEDRNLTPQGRRVQLTLAPWQLHVIEVTGKAR